MAVCREMGRFFSLVCVFKGGYVSWVQAVHELGFNLISASCCRFWRAVEMLNLHQTSNQNLWVSHFITHKTHPQRRCHLVFVSFMWSGKFSYFCSPARKLSPRDSVTLRGLSGVSHTCVNNVCAEWADDIIPFCCGVHFTNTTSPVQKHGYSSFSLRAMPPLRTGFST